VSPEQAGRLAALYAADEKGLATPVSGPPLDRRPRCLSASGGLVASALDYHRFMELLRRSGELGGTRLLGPRTVDYMTVNHLPGGADLRDYGCYEGFGDNGIGFGLGVAVTVDPVAAKVAASAGEYGWSGAASTRFWVDPREDLTVQFLTQLRPVQPVPILSQLKQLVYQAIVE
jgi:CubicO group peptidase (beta-lactamase class C family)